MVVSIREWNLADSKWALSKAKHVNGRDASPAILDASVSFSSMYDVETWLSYDGNN